MSPKTDLDFPAFLALLRRRAKLIAAITIAAAALAFAISTLLPDRYDASADLLFRAPTPAPKINPNENEEANSEPERVAATNLALASLDVVAVRVKKSTDTSMSIEELRDSVSIEPQGQADLATITASADTPEEAADIANGFATEVVALRREKAQAKIQDVVEAIHGQLEESETVDPEVARHLESRASQLEVQERLESGDAEVVEQATPPDNPASPKPLRNAIIAAILGLILGIVVAVLLRRYDRHLEDEDDIADIVGGPIVGRVPMIDEGDDWRYELALESFQFLRANLQLSSASAGYRSFAVTSALPGEGKSTVAIRLAEAIALSGSSVILVDGDLRRPTLHTALGVSADAGVTTALSSDVDPSGLLIETPIPNVSLLPAGPLTVMPGTMITGDHDIGKLLARLGELADYVIVDTSPVTIGADASTIASEVNGTLIVVDTKAVEQAPLAAAVEQLRNAEVKVAGVVLNKAGILLDDRAYQGYYRYSRGREAVSHVPPVGKKRQPRPEPAAGNRPLN